MEFSIDAISWEIVIQDTFPNPPMTGCITEVKTYTAEMLNKMARYIKFIAVNYHGNYGAAIQFIAWT